MTYASENENTTKDLARFALKHDGWHTFATDRETISLICAGVNLKVVRINEFTQFTALRENCERYLA